VAEGGVRMELIHSRIELKAQKLSFPLDWIQGQRYFLPPTKSDVMETGISLSGNDVGICLRTTIVYKMVLRFSNVLSSGYRRLIFGVVNLPDREANHSLSYICVFDKPHLYKE
jgi:hypothetical protein